MRPGPTAMTVPSCGFSLAVSGMTRPEAVVVSASLAWTTTRSSSGLMLTLVAVVTSVTPPSVSDGCGRGCRCCGTGYGHPPSRGSGAGPCRFGTLPTRVPAAQPGPARRTGHPVGQAVPVEGEPVEQAAETVRRLRALATPDGAVALSRAAALLADGTDEVSALTRLRAEV